MQMISTLRHKGLASRLAVISSEGVDGLVEGE